MKPASLVLLLCVLAAPVASAREMASASGAATGTASGGFANLGQQLGLSKEQRAKVTGILRQRSAALRTLRNNTNLTGAQKQDLMRAIQRKTVVQIRALLTSDQQRRFDVLMAGSSQNAAKRKPRR